jgi:hypothetical protein
VSGNHPAAGSPYEQEGLSVTSGEALEELLGGYKSYCCCREKSE